jgi:hypothetical protein
MSSDPTNQFGSSQYGSPRPFPVSKPPSPFQANSSAGRPEPHQSSGGEAVQGTQGTQAVGVVDEKPAQPTETAKPASSPAVSKLTADLQRFDKVALAIREQLTPAPDFQARCRQAFDVANDLFGNAPTWVCFYRELLGGSGMIHRIFASNEDLGAFLRTEEYHQIQLMLTALRSRDLPENDPNDPQRMITVRLPKSLHEAMCEEAGRLNISVNRLCISRMLQMLDPKMIPETTSKPRGRKPRTRSKQQ